uniref:Dystrophin n=1 Tax=Ditylenchus dipsaci TaxID=166011 RepID=A0A915DTQ2_9BILA
MFFVVFNPEKCTSGSEEDSEKADTTAQLTKFEEIAHELRSKLEAIAAIPDLDGAELNKKMEKLRPLKDKFDTKALKIVGQHSYENPIEDEELRKKVTQEVGQVAALWQKITAAQPLHQKKRTLRRSPNGGADSQQQTARTTLPRLDSHDLPVLMTNEATVGEGTSASLAANARSLLTDFRNAKQYLDFNQFPVTNLQEWESRLKDLNEWKVAEGGRMELETHDALARLDDLIEIVHKIDSELEEQEQHLQATQFKRQTFLDGLHSSSIFLQGLSTQLDTLKEVDQGQLAAINSLVPIIQPIQQDLMEACSQLRVLQLAADDLHKALPGYSSHLQNLKEAEAMDQLNAQLREIEGRVQEALVKALQAQEAMSVSQSEEQPVRSNKQADTTSVHSLSSGAGLSLAMDVQDTEGEDESRKQDSEVLKTSVSVRPVRRLQVAEGEEYTLEQFYVNLDTIEEYLEQQEYLPFEGIEEKLEILQDFEVELDRGEQLIQTKQMTMDLAESEHFLQKVAALQQQLASKRRTLEQRRGALTGLDAIFEQCETSIAGLGIRWKQQMVTEIIRQPCPAGSKTPPNTSHPLDSNGRNRSPDLDELEASQLELEDQLPPLAVNLQQCSNRLANCIDQLSTATKDRLQSKLQQMTLDFNEYSKEIRERRKHLEERLADQTHLLNQLEMLEFWCDETEANITGLPSILDIEQLDYHCQLVLEKFNEMPEKLEAMRLLDNLKDRFVALATVEPDVKHEIRRNVTQLAKRISDLKLEVNSKFKEEDDQKLTCQQFWTEVQQLEVWLKHAFEQLTVVQQAKIYRPSMVNIEKLAVEAEENRTTTLLPIQTRLEQEVNKLDGQLNANEKCSHERVLELVRQFDMVCDQFNRVLQENALLSSDSDLEEGLEDLYTKMDATKARLQQAQEEAPATNGHFPKHPENGNESISQSTEYGTLSKSQAQGMEEQLTAEELTTLLTIKWTRMMTTATKDILSEKMSVGEQGRLDTVTRLRSTLQEIERDISITVDLADPNIVRQAISKAQNWIDELNIDQIEVLRIVDEAKDKLVIERAQLARQGMDKILVVCQRRKLELQHILEQCRSWEQLRGQIELWLTDANEKVTRGGKVNELNDSALKDQLQLITYLHDQAEVWKEEMKSFNDRSNELLDVYRRDDGHNLSHLASKLNTQWTKFNDSLRIRRAVLEAAQRSRSDFHSALGQFQQWLMAESSQMARLERATDNVQRLKDTSKRKDWMAEKKRQEPKLTPTTQLWTPLGKWVEN